MRSMRAPLFRPLRTALVCIRESAPSCAAALALATALAVPAFADTIVDTGPGPATTGGTVLNLATSDNDPFVTQYLAGEFSLTSPHTITALQGWIHVSIASAGALTFVIYGDGGGVPDVTAPLFSIT